MRLCELSIICPIFVFSTHAQIIELEREHGISLSLSLTYGIMAIFIQNHPLWSRELRPKVP